MVLWFDDTFLRDMQISGRLYLTFNIVTQTKGKLSQRTEEINQNKYLESFVRFSSKLVLEFQSTKLSYKYTSIL